MWSLQSKRLVAITLVAFTVGCGGGSSNSNISNPPPAVVTITPSSASVALGQRQQFTVTVTGTSNTAVAWQVNGVAGGNTSTGTISCTGLYTAPSSVPSVQVTVSAVSQADASKTASAAVTVSTSNPPPVVVTIAPSSASVTVGKQQQFTATVTGTSNTAVTWQVNGVAGGNATTGTVSSTGLYTAPSSVPSGQVTVTAVSQADATKTASASVTITATTAACTTSLPPPSPGFDGSAELPRVFMDTTVPTQTGKVTTVVAGGDLQSALNSANCGDTIELQAGAVFTGNYSLPAKSCTDTSWIMIRTATPDSALPAPGSRITPCYAGVASLPGRPNFSCTSTNNVMAQLQVQNTAPALAIAQGATHYWIGPGLEITRAVNGTSLVGGLVEPAAGGDTFDHVVIDRDWLHGDAQDETGNGFLVSGGSYVAVIDSFFTDFHCVSVTGFCVESHAITGGTGSPTSVFKFNDNFLESAAQSFLFGGGGATGPPTDIEFRYNHMFKPLMWLSGQPGFVGGSNGNPFVVKNHFELKNAQRVLYEANLGEYSWGGFSQTGYSILLTPKNQAGAPGQNVCPACLVDDVTIRYSQSSHLGGGMQTGIGVSDNGGVPADGQRWSIHDVIVDDVNPTLFNGNGYLFEFGQCPGCPNLQNFLINHITGFDTQGYITINATVPPLLNNVNLENSIVSGGAGQFAAGGTGNCAPALASATTVLQDCFNSSNSTFNATAFIGGTGSYPANNFFPANAAAVGFTNYNNGDGGDYTLLSTSPYHHAGTDGKDLGADTCTVTSAVNAAR